VIENSTALHTLPLSPQVAFSQWLAAQTATAASVSLAAWFCNISFHLLTITFRILKLHKQQAAVKLPYRSYRPKDTSFCNPTGPTGAGKAQVNH
jgi:hypothetical protein